MSVFALGIWTVKDGREDAFVEAWLQVGQRLKDDFPERTATLLHDREQPNRFISFGRSDSLEVLEKRRDSLASQAKTRETEAVLATGRMMELVADLALFTLDVVGEVK